MPATLRRGGGTAPPTASNTTSSATTDASAIATTTAAAQRLRQHFAAVRVAFTWFGIRKSLSAEQLSEAAQSFGTEGQYLSAAKKLLDTKCEPFRAVTAVRSSANSYWKGLTLPFPDPGVRLIRQDDVGRFNDRMTVFRDELDAAVGNLDDHYGQLRDAARGRLGRLFNPADYPASLRGLFGLAFDFPSVEPPEYLLRLNPHLFQQERQRIAARFDEAVQLAEEAFVGEFAKLVAHLTERLTAGPDGERKVFRDSAVGNLTTFFERFRSLSVRSNADLDRLVETARQALSGVDPHVVRNSATLRQQVTTQLSAVQSVLDGMLVDQPRRRILRQGRGTAPEGAAG